MPPCQCPVRSIDQRFRSPQCPCPHSLRLLPHLQDTGGFFVAILRKLGPVNAKSARRRALALDKYGEAVVVASHRQRAQQKAARVAALQEEEAKARAAKAGGGGGGRRAKKGGTPGRRQVTEMIDIGDDVRKRIVDTFGLPYVRPPPPPPPPSSYCCEGCSAAARSVACVSLRGNATDSMRA